MNMYKCRWNFAFLCDFVTPFLVILLYWNCEPMVRREVLKTWDGPQQLYVVVFVGLGTNGNEFNCKVKSKQLYEQQKLQGYVEGAKDYAKHLYIGLFLVNGFFVWPAESADDMSICDYWTWWRKQVSRHMGHHPIHTCAWRLSTTQNADGGTKLLNPVLN